MKKKRNYMHKSNWWKYLLAVVIVIFHVLPLYVLVVMAFKTKTDMSSLLTIPNYFYPDNPQNYQNFSALSPICRNGQVEINVDRKKEECKNP